MGSSKLGLGLQMRPMLGHLYNVLNVTEVIFVVGGELSRLLMSSVCFEFFVLPVKKFDVIETSFTTV